MLLLWTAICVVVDGACFLKNIGKNIGTKPQKSKHKKFKSVVQINPNHIKIMALIDWIFVAIIKCQVICGIADAVLCAQIHCVMSWSCENVYRTLCK